MLCECGCGEPTRLSPKTNKRQGYTRGLPRRFIRGHQFRKHMLSKTPAYRKAVWLRHKYGLLLEEFDAMVEQQNSECAICKEVKKLYVDHDHATEKVRGLLCNRCNIRLAAVDDSEWMEKARAYVARS